MNVTMKKRGRGRPPTDDAPNWWAIKMHYVNGFDVSELARKYGITRRAIQLHAKKAGWDAERAGAGNAPLPEVPAGVSAGLEHHKRHADVARHTFDVAAERVDKCETPEQLRSLTDVFVKMAKLERDSRVAIAAAEPAPDPADEGIHYVRTVDPRKEPAVATSPADEVASA
jgi:hypothetical protein